MKLKNKFALVTGASTGIGRAIAIEFAKEGAFVVLTARTKKRLEKTKELIENAGGKAKIFVADLSKIDSINSLIANIKKETKCTSPQEIAQFAVYLCSSQADKITGKVFVMKKGKKPFEGFHR